MFKLIRSFTGIWSILRRILRLIEWNLTHGIAVQSKQFGDFMIYGSLPPSEKEIKQAESEKYEHHPFEDEEKLAGERAVELYKRRAAGEKIDPDEPGSDFSLL